MGGLYVVGTTKSRKSLGYVMQVLEKFNPGQVFLETSNHDLQKGNYHRLSLDFLVAYNWAKRNNKSICGFDSEIDGQLEIFKGKCKKTLIQMTLFCEYEESCELNKTKYDKSFKYLESLLYDTDVLNKRREEMISRIRGNRSDGMTSLVLVSVEHLHYFAKKMKEAQFPYRD